MLSVAGCSAEKPVGSLPSPAPPFSEATGVGLDFEHSSGATGEYYFCEIVGAGGAFLDFDGDGDLDVFCVQGGTIPFDPQKDSGASHRLYQNRWVEDGHLRFRDVTATSGDLGRGYGMGVATADYDSDGDVDLYVTRFGPNQLLRNNGDGTFTEVGEAAGVDDARWSTSACFLDYDMDGHLDLFVCNYVDYSLRNHKECYSESSARDYCGPLSYPAVADTLYRGRGDGTFDDVTHRARIGQHFGAALGVVTADLNADGWIDIYVANDGSANQCWINRSDGTFSDEALLAGCAYDESGRAEASMGVLAEDFDNDGDEDLFMTHLTTETNTYYRNNGHGVFEDTTVHQGLALASRPFTGFGTGVVDYDGDGWLDLFLANGAVKAIDSLRHRGDPHPFHQVNQLFRNTGQGRFQDVTAVAGEAFRRSEVSRGSAFGDVDNDGDVDVLVTNNNGPVRLLLGASVGERSWIGLRLVEATGRPAPPGVRVQVELPSGRTLWRRVRTDGSYCSANDPRLLFGLGTENAVVRVRVHWPGAPVEDWLRPSVNRYVTLARGQGVKSP